jgi:hypothetical protein
MLRRPRLAAAFAIAAVIASGSLGPAVPSAIAAPTSPSAIPDRTGYALTDTGWDGVTGPTFTVDARDASRAVSFLATVRDPAGAPADPGLALGFVRTAARVPAPAFPTPATTVGPGRVSFSLAVAKGSQDLEVDVPRRPAVTEAFAAGGDAAARVTASLVVRATTTAIATRRRVAAGGRVAVRGRLDGRAGDPTGTVVRVQLRRGTTWRTVGTAAVSEDVRWRTVVRLPRGVRGRTALRAIVVPSATCPYARGAATPVTVTAR